MRSFVSVFFLFISFLFFSASLFASEKVNGISVKSAVVFNILCAKCHEGQCSGRLSFDTGSEAATNHIKRYANNKNASKAEIKEFFTLLNYMKKECRLVMPDVEKDKKEKFSIFALASFKGYFIPLGILKKGNYNLIIKTKEDNHFDLEILSDGFDIYFKKTICPCSKEQIFNFTVDKSINCFLRIKSRKPLHVTKLKVEKN